jgi:hypothetical protein
MEKLFKIVALVAIVGLAAPAWAQGPLPAPVPRQVTPQWTPVPGARGVEYAPNLGADFFRHSGGYYYLHDGRWYQGRNTSGPWTQVQSLPQVFYQVEAPYFKRPPGWAKGKKTGWGGAPMPPGQMKKMQGGGPPGQMKKKGW